MRTERQAYFIVGFDRTVGHPAGLAERTRPTVLDVIVTSDPAHILPAVDNRTVDIRQGDRVA
jgi:hypothetical protein